MKTTILLATLGLAFAFPVLPIQAHETTANQAATASEKGGPHGGRVITSTNPAFEFLVRPDRTLVLTFLNAKLQPIPLQEQTASAIGGDRSNPTRFTFSRKGETLVSDQPLPEGNRIPIIVSVKTTPEAGAAVEKFTVDLATCPTCDHQEYACICGH